MSKKESKATKEETLEKEEKVSPEKESEKAEEEVKKESSKEPTKEEKLTAELQQKEDKLLRIAAEYDNFRRRSIKEKEETFKNAKISVISDFLEVVDNFERAATNECEYEDYKKGIEMIFNQFKDILKKLGAEQFGEAGEEFDPEVHNAVMHVEDEELGENIIKEVFQKGYKIGDKVVRHATVVVAN